MNQTLSPVHSAKLRGFVIATITLMSASLLATAASAQSGTKTAARTSNAAGSGTKSAGNTVGLQGYCPVCVVQMKKWIKGNPQFSVQQDGKTYLFPGEEQKQMFLSNPAQYTPVLGGDCAVALVEMNKRVPGSVQHAALHNDRLYLFSNDKAKGMFVANKEKYANADLALGGKCSVCRVEMNQDVDGVPQFTSIYEGLRYQFPGNEQQQMFNQNPAKYDVTK
jgi:YHS domain-containing protein